MRVDSIIHIPPLERAANCELHGDYISECHMRSFWLGCPTCSTEKQSKEDADQAAHDQRLKTQEWQAKVEGAGIPPRFRDRTITGYIATTPEQLAAVNFARDYAMNFAAVRESGRCALFLGKPGTGKTHLATAIGLHAMRVHHAKVMFTTVLRAVRSVKDSWVKGSGVSEGQVIASMVKPDLLILDEVGVQFGSEFEKNILFDVFNERYELRKPTILLSNLTKDEVQSFVGERVIDRIKEDGGAVVAFTWDSHRKNLAAGG